MIKKYRDHALKTFFCSISPLFIGLFKKSPRNYTKSLRLENYTEPYSHEMANEIVK